MEEEKRYNEIDMETTTFDDTDSFELSEDNKVIKFDAGYEAAKNKDRGIQSNIGSNTLSFNKLDFSDENYIPSKTETIKNKYNFKSWDSDVIVSDKTLTLNDSMPITSAFNAVDMETDFYDDEDMDFGSSSNKKKIFDFDDEEEELINKELMFEDTLEEKKKKKPITSGAVEDDYWKNLQKKHAKTNVKGAAGWHERVFAGDPERERELFNHDMNSAIASAKDASVIPTGSVDKDFSYNNADAISGDISGSAGGEASGGMSESLEKNYNQIFKKLLNLLGFKVFKSNNIYKLIDLYNFKNKIDCKTKEDVFSQLKPYIMDYIIYPLQNDTEETYDNYVDWCNWYKGENCKKYPNNKDDIIYCDLLANHIKDINL